MNAIVMTLTTAQLDSVRGGADTFGRCGPGGALQGVLGNVYTPECKAHDAAVRRELQTGRSYLGAQWKALGLLPAAVGSWFRERFS